jgi:hypothetical protein
MKVELKNVKYMDSLSEETACFTATIYINGKKAGTATNHGIGGNTDVRITDKDLEARFFAWAKTLPKLQTEFGSLEMDGELYIDELLEQHLKEKDRQKEAKQDAKQKARIAAMGCLALKVSYAIPNGTAFVYVPVKSRKEIDKAIANLKLQMNFDTCKHEVL